jgi:hypothetical protein
MASNPKLIALFEKLGSTADQLKEDFTYKTGAELKVVNKRQFAARTPAELIGRVIQLDSYVLDVLEDAISKDDIEAGLTNLFNLIIHEEGHRVGLIKYGDENNHTRNSDHKEDGNWVTNQYFGPNYVIGASIFVGYKNYKDQVLVEAKKIIEVTKGSGNSSNLPSSEPLPKTPATKRPTPKDFEDLDKKNKKEDKDNSWEPAQKK